MSISGGIVSNFVLGYDGKVQAVTGSGGRSERILLGAMYAYRLPALASSRCCPNVLACCGGDIERLL